MCFSVQVDQDIKKLSKSFSAKVNEEAYGSFNELSALETKIGQRAFLDKLGMTKSRLRKIPIIKKPKEDGIVYSNYFTNIITATNDGLQIEPMRYRVRPARSKDEIPSKYNVFNARMDALEKRETWKNIYGKNHGLIVISKFYEWVNRNNSKKLVSFSPTEYEQMLVPCIWDEWKSVDGEISFKSFAIITTEPPNDVLKNGHDRCPVFMSKSSIDSWLNRKEGNESYTAILDKVESSKYQCQVV